jgi:hypothetical protein
LNRNRIFISATEVLFIVKREVDLYFEPHVTSANMQDSPPRPHGYRMPASVLHLHRPPYCNATATAGNSQNVL